MTLKRLSHPTTVSSTRWLSLRWLTNKQTKKKLIVAIHSTAEKQAKRMPDLTVKTTMGQLFPLLLWNLDVKKSFWTETEIVCYLPFLQGSRISDKKYSQVKIVPCHWIVQILNAGLVSIYRQSPVKSPDIKTL